MHKKSLRSQQHRNRLVYNGGPICEHRTEIKMGKQRSGGVAKRTTIFFPTLLSLEKRSKLAKESHLELALLDMDQGLHYFFDLI